MVKSPYFGLGIIDCAYSVVVRTSNKENAGTTANIFVQLTDVEGMQTDKVRLKCSISHRKKFQRGHSDLFLLIEQNPLSKLKSLEVWHEKKGDCKPWLLHSVYIIEHMHHILYQFPCHKWLGDDPDDLVIFFLCKENYISSVKLNVSGQPFKVLQEDEL
uniref:PLAT domain-containing protein n=1 Tax=Wuchereria bancrofti TaxID=6293 RepID=A0A1I8EN82_WUCBA